jgi:vacuolar-type H+-ATPase subunit H
MADEERIRRVLEIERQARALYEASVHEAEQLPQAAEREAREELQRIVAAAQTEAKRILADAQSEQERADILAQAEKDIRQMEDGAKERMNRAVEFVLDAVAGEGEG